MEIVECRTASNIPHSTWPDLILKRQENKWLSGIREYENWAVPCVFPNKVTTEAQQGEVTSKLLPGLVLSSPGGLSTTCPLQFLLYQARLSVLLMAGLRQGLGPNHPFPRKFWGTRMFMSGRASGNHWVAMQFDKNKYIFVEFYFDKSLDYGNQRIWLEPWLCHSVAV